MIGYCLLLLCDRLLLTITNEKKNNFNCKFKGKLHFTTLNYTPDYTLHPKLFEWTFCILNYDICYTFHPNTLTLSLGLLWTECSITWFPRDYCLSVTKSKDPNALFQVQKPKRRYTDSWYQSFPLTHNLVFWVSPCTNPHRSVEIEGSEQWWLGGDGSWSQMVVPMVARSDLGFVLVMIQNLYGQLQESHGRHVIVLSV